MVSLVEDFEFALKRMIVCFAVHLLISVGDSYKFGTSMNPST